MDGSRIPEVDFDVGPSWAGLLPISGDPDETRKVRLSRRTPQLHILKESAILLVFPSRPPR